MAVSSSRSTGPGRGPARWLRRGGGALLASAAAHAAAAVAIGGALGSARPATPPAGHEPSPFQVELDVDVPVIVTPAAAIPAPQSTPRATPAPTAAAATTATRPVLAARRGPLPRAARAPLVPQDETVAPIARPSPEAAMAPALAAPRFTMSAGTVASGPAPARQAGAPGPGSRSDAMDGPESRAVDERAVDVAARLLPGAPPAYPPAAREAEIESDLPLEIVVDARGQVISARGLTHAGYGLDEAALRAIRGYRFTPARRGGQAVPVRMRWTVQFRLR